MEKRWGRLLVKGSAPNFLGDKEKGYCFYEAELTVDIGELEGNVEASYALRYCHAGRYLYAFDPGTETFTKFWNFDGLPSVATHPQGYGAGTDAGELEILHAFKVGLIAGAISLEDVQMLKAFSASGLRIDHWFDVMHRVLEEGASPQK